MTRTPDPAPTGPRPTASRVLLRAAALGAGSGARSTTGPAALAFTAVPAGTPVDRVVAVLAGRRARTVAGLLAAAEVVADKLPATPSRLGPAGLVPRLVLGAGSAAVMARRDGYRVALPAAVGLATAAVTAVLGVRVRAAAARRLGSDRPVAVAEDVLAAVLGRIGARTR